MKEKDKNSNLSARQSGNVVRNNLKGYPLYPESEDIYNKYQEDRKINPGEISKTEESADADEVLEIDENDSNNGESDNDLDVPGAELDDELENIGSEDEENNYYSIDDDDPEDLEADKEA